MDDIDYQLNQLPEKYREQARRKYQQKLSRPALRPGGAAGKQEAGPQPKKHKYRAKPVTFDGIRFPSKFEGEYYLRLKKRLAAGQIRSFDRQPRFPLLVNDSKICEYRADFRVYELDGSITIIDTKGMKTPVYRLKRKLMEACYPQTPIVEVYRKDL